MIEIAGKYGTAKCYATNIELKRDAMLFVDAKAWNAQNNTVIDRFVGNPFRNKTFKDGSWVDKN